MELSNAKWERFCLEYAKSANATDSYRKVYKSKSSTQVLSQSASRLLKNEKIQARLAELHEEMASEKIANAAEVQERLTRILRLEETEDVVVLILILREHLKTARKQAISSPKELFQQKRTEFRKKFNIRPYIKQRTRARTLLNSGIQLLTGKHVRRTLSLTDSLER